MIKQISIAVTGATLVTAAFATPVIADEGSVATQAIGRLYTMGGKFKNQYNIRTDPSTKYAKVGTVRGKGKSLPCMYNYCRGAKRGGTYRCYAGAAKENTWVPLKYKGRKVWAAQECGALGR
ncbi:hypothetical protein ACQEU6_12290 [Spirillospora sp. CA-108201]